MTSGESVTGVVIERDVSIAMRDGVVLRADIYRPAIIPTDGLPAVMERTPYGKDRSRLSQVLDPVRAAEAGLVVVAQDTRGQGRSDGAAFYPFRDDFVDGYDTAEWIASQPFSNGRVGAYGVSYGGNASWQAAVAAPPSLGAIAPVMSPIDWTDGWQVLTRDGVLKWGLTLAWTVDHIFESQVRRFVRPDTLRTGLEAAAGLIDDFESLARTVPLTAVGDRLRELVVELAGGEGQAGAGDVLQYFDDVVRRRPLPLANGSPVRGRTHAAVKVPVRLTAGWYDVILGHDLEHFRRMREHSTARAATRLTIGPWSHSNFTNLVGELDFGRRSMGASLDLGASISSDLVEWFRSELTASPLTPDDTPPVRAFMQGIDRWRFEDDWPPPGMVPEAWHLHGGGRLDRTAPAWEPASDTFVYDPADPCPTLGGDLVKPPSYVPGPVDQRPNLGRRDVLCYRSGPLERDLWLLGPVRAELVTATSGRGTDWVVKLCDVHPDGRVVNVCDGISRTGDTAGGVVDEVTIDLWATGIVLRAGHELAVIVTSSDFPRYERNPNTGTPPWEATSFDVALQHVFHTPERPSRIILPVVSQERTS